MKLASMFFIASAEYLRGLPQRYKQTSGYKTCNYFETGVKLPKQKNQGETIKPILNLENTNSLKRGRTRLSV
jgi:hypothetical protein